MASAAAGPSRSQSFKGSGLAILRSHPAPGDTLGCTFTHLRFSFPLKLIHPRTSGRDAGLLLARAGKVDAPGIGRKAIAVLYIVGYGGGLVSGDDVELDVDVGERCTLLLLTQGSTKVFKMRSGLSPSGQRGEGVSYPPSSSSSADMEWKSSPVTRQYTRLLIRPNSTLLLLPDPVTCYASSRYAQTQRFDVQCRRTSSLVLLDWFTPGRQHLSRRSGDSTGGTHSEFWKFESYRSRNEVRMEGRVILRDVLLLEQAEDQCVSDDSELTELGRRNYPYSCYANLFLLGPDVQLLLARLNEEFQAIQQRVVPSNHNRNARMGASSSSSSSSSSSQPPSILWSLTILNEDGGSRDQARVPVPSSTSSSSPSKDQGMPVDHRQAVVRIAGLDTESVRDWLRLRLSPLEHIVGKDLYKQAMW